MNQIPNNTYFPSKRFQYIPKAPLGILSTPGGRDLAKLIDEKLILHRKNMLSRYPYFEDFPGYLRESYLIESTNPRFSNGEGKAVITDSVRGLDLYIVTDVGNWGKTYKRNGIMVSMCPDEHFQDLKRLISAARGFGARINVIMPLLYESRQHKVAGRESLDCAMALQELVNMGVQNIMTIDAHNSHVQNAIPNYGFENLHANYQLIKGLIQNESEFRMGSDLVVVSPDLGGLERCRYFAEQLHAELTAFYKLRDLTQVVDGKAPVIEHRFFGGDLEGKDAMIVDDLIASGESVLEVARELKAMKANKVYAACTFTLFTSGIDEFQKACDDGIIDHVFGTNATYNRPELKEVDWFTEVDVSRFIALYIDSFNRNQSVSRLLDNTLKIRALLEEKGLLKD
jgi:ribose-phosphate pyrophosphokinase